MRSLPATLLCARDMYTFLLHSISRGTVATPSLDILWMLSIHAKLLHSLYLAPNIWDQIIASSLLTKSAVVLEIMPEILNSAEINLRFRIISFLCIATPNKVT